MILIIDNYDSFTYNLVQYFGELNDKILVLKNNQANINEIVFSDISHIVISPGPGTPNDSKLSLEVISYAISASIPLLGICLGHQAIGLVFLGEICSTKNIMHGKISTITQTKKSILYKNIPVIFKATRYHSLVINRKKSLNDIVVTAISDDGEIMSIEHNSMPIFGVQYHPESIQTKYGKQIIKNFINIA